MKNVIWLALLISSLCSTAQAVTVEFEIPVDRLPPKAMSLGLTWRQEHETGRKTKFQIKNNQCR